MELVELKELRTVLEEYAAQFAEVYKYQIALGNHNASRDLVNSIKTYVETDGRAWEVSVELKHYWKYLEGGAKGTQDSPSGAVYPAHMPPPWAIEKWINVKPVIPRPRADGNIPSPKQLSYAIAKSIEKHGQEPFPAMATTMEELNEMFTNRFVTALNADIEDYIVKVLFPLIP